MSASSQKILAEKGIKDGSTLAERSEAMLARKKKVLLNVSHDVSKARECVSVCCLSALIHQSNQQGESQFHMRASKTPFPSPRQLQAPDPKP